MNKKIFLILGILFISFSYLIFTSFMENRISYLSINEVINNINKFKNKEIRITGIVLDNSLEEKLLKDSKIYRFKIKDKFDLKDSKIITIIYRGILPDSFNYGIDIVCTGYIKDNGIFHVKTLISKCPSKYEK